MLSGDDAWLVALDAFGCTLQRARPEDLVDLSFDVECTRVSFEPTCVKGFGKILPLPDAGSLTSAAGNERTLLLTTAHSYAVTVVALEGSP